jgi:hypothetical protein
LAAGEEAGAWKIFVNSPGSDFGGGEAGVGRGALKVFVGSLSVSGAADGAAGAWNIFVNSPGSDLGGGALGVGILAVGEAAGD